MKRMTAFILALLLAACAIPFTAAADKAVTVDGVTQKLNWDNMFIKDGNMVITMKGFDQVGGEKFGNLSVLIGDEEIIAYAAKDIGDGKCDYSFTGCKALPDAIVFRPDDGSNSRILIPELSASSIHAEIDGNNTGPALSGLDGRVKVIDIRRGEHATSNNCGYGSNHEFLHFLFPLFCGVGLVGPFPDPFAFLRFCNHPIAIAPVHYGRLTFLSPHTIGL